jgi:hypothetical protein
MPIPRPKSGEKQKDFIERCVFEISKEYKTDKALAICYKQYREKI